MATSRIYLQGGPCNGRTVSASQIQGGLVGYIACGGGYYVDSGRTRPNGNTIFRYSGSSPPQPPSAGGIHAAHALQGWTDLRRKFNRDLPLAVHRLGKLNRHTLSVLARHHRVRG